MSQYSDSEVNTSFNVYEENLNNETILDFSSKNLQIIPEVNSDLLCVIYLQNNKITTLSEDFFSLLPNLMYLDLRNNLLTCLPRSIKNHRCLTHLLLQNNNIEYLPDELGTVVTLKVIQLSYNPLKYPPNDIIMGGCSKIVSFLRGKFIDDLGFQSPSIVSECPQFDCGLSTEARSYNSVLDQDKLRKTMSVQLSEKGTESDEDYYSKNQGKCPKLPKSRSKILSAYSQSSKYLRPLRTCSKIMQDQKMKKSIMKDMEVKKKKEILAAQEKILQGRRNLEVLKNWRKAYSYKQLFYSGDNTAPRTYPYDTSPEYMTLLSREDIEKDLPDKYRKKLVRRSKQSIPRRDNADVHLAMKIKQLFENLEAIDLNRDGMTPRTEQKALLGEIQKISEIKQKLKELSSNNIRSVMVD